jgi:hypothetical protein
MGNYVDQVMRFPVVLLPSDFEPPSTYIKPYLKENNHNTCAFIPL